MCPIVPTFKCGLSRTNFSFAIRLSPRKTKIIRKTFGLAMKSPQWDLNP
jgi:hypothetical protein